MDMGNWTRPEHHADRDRPRTHDRKLACRYRFVECARVRLAAVCLLRKGPSASAFAFADQRLQDLTNRSALSLVALMCSFQMTSTFNSVVKLVDFLAPVQSIAPPCDQLQSIGRIADRYSHYELPCKSNYL